MGMERTRKLEAMEPGSEELEKSSVREWTGLKLVGEETVRWRALVQSQRPVTQHHSAATPSRRYIDLGTTNSCVWAVAYNSFKARNLWLSRSGPFLLLSHEQLVVGLPTESRAIVDPTNSVFALKC
ncbi:hypothetical protein BDP27DRAFT_1377412 [Rhodocollybia butyracea]|uniref:Uncharacterized protein n=1 Tax=Rhodocollybia butyracea TaxID=206335 RepID=A0A9P5TVL8_9AGAR|nr:hypothetical protein BDP27DRAFT_1377412 [Rhodocollybia butyracea]